MRAHFLVVNMRMSMAKLTQLFIKEIIGLLGVPSSIGSDKDLQFIYTFWQTFQEAMESRLMISFAYHPQTDRSQRRQSIFLEDPLRTCALNILGGWDEVLPFVEFTYNNNFKGKYQYDTL